MRYGPFSFLQRQRRLFAGAMLALLLQSLAWGVGAESSTDVLESEGNAVVHEQGCTDDDAAAAGGEAIDGHCNEACHFWSQFHTVFASHIDAALAASPVLQPVFSVFVFDNPTFPPFRPPRASLPV
jgi:hypothetical protein